MEYYLFERAHAPMKLQVYLEPQNETERGQAGSVGFWLSRDYLDRLEIKQISPEPEQVIAGPDRLTYHFRVDDPEGTVVTFRAEPDQAGPLSGRVGLPDQEALSFRQFIYP